MSAKDTWETLKFGCSLEQAAVKYACDKLEEYGMLSTHFREDYKKLKPKTFSELQKLIEKLKAENIEYDKKMENEQAIRDFHVSMYDGMIKTAKEDYESFIEEHEE